MTQQGLHLRILFTVLDCCEKYIYKIYIMQRFYFSWIKCNCICCSICLSIKPSPSVWDPHLLLLIHLLRFIFVSFTSNHPLCLRLPVKSPDSSECFWVKYVKVITKCIDWVNNVTIRYLSSFSLKMQESILGAARSSGMEAAEGHLSFQVIYISCESERTIFPPRVSHLLLTLAKCKPWQEKGNTKDCQMSSIIMACEELLTSLWHTCFWDFVLCWVHGEWGHIKVLLIILHLGFWRQVFWKLNGMTVNVTHKAENSTRKDMHLRCANKAIQTFFSVYFLHRFEEKSYR